MAPPVAEEAEEPRAPRRGPGPFSLVVLLLALLVAGGAAWLQLTYEPPPPPVLAQVELTLPAPEEPAPEASVQANLAPPAPEAAPAPAAPPAEPPAPPPSQAAVAAAPAEEPEAVAPERSEPAQAEPAPAPPEPPAETAAAAPSSPPDQDPPPQATAPTVETSPPQAAAPEPAAPRPQAEAAPQPSAAPPAPASPAAPSLAPQPQPERHAALAAPRLPTESWRAFAQPFEAKPGLPRIAIVIWDLGLSPEPTRAAIRELPPEVTLGFAPYGVDLQKWADQARAAGHEVVLQAPMEPERFPENDPGPHTLLTGLAPQENLERLQWVLGRFKGYVGVVNYMGSRFTASPEDLRPVLAHLKERGLIFLDSRAGAQSVADRVAAELGLAHAANTRYLDNEASRIAIEARLEELEKIARERGRAVGIGYHYPVTIDRLAHWAKTLPGKGLQLAPLSAVVSQGQGREG